MYKITSIYFIINILIIFLGIGNADEKVSEFRLPSLKTVIEYAKKTSPKIKFQKSLVRKNKNRTNVERLTWIKAFSVNINGKSASSVDKSSFGLDNGYQAGMSIKVDLFEIFSRNERVSMHQNETSSSVYMAQEEEKELSLEITRLYNNIKLSEKLLQIESKTYQTALLNLTTVKENFFKGEIELTQLNEVKDDLSKKKIGFEIRKADYKNLYSTLEIILGTRLDKVK